MQLNSVLVRLADEGIPVRAIARGLQIPSEEVRELLGEAVQAGNLLAVPKDDWPPLTGREERLPAFMGQFHDDTLILHIGYCFAVSRMQSAVLLQFLRRREVTRDFLHSTLEAQRAARGPAPSAKGPVPAEVVSVVLWALRQRLKAYFDGHRVIVTVTGQGYLMVPEYRRRANDMLAEHLGMPWRRPNLCYAND